MRKLTLSLLALLILVPNLISAHGGVNDDELIIRMTKNGFEPKELTVVEGDIVLFINNDDVPRWPASNFHPTHTLYPEFDPLGGIQPGQSWKMRFEKTGTWRMHDHLFPHFTGTIVVLADPGKTALTPIVSGENGSSTTSELPPIGFWEKIKLFFQNLFGRKASGVSIESRVDQKLLKEFKNSDERAKYAWLEKRAELENPEIAWAYVIAAYKTPLGVVGNPHDMAHLVGQLLYKKYGLDGLSVCTTDFAFGCYHGLMEVAFDEDLGNEPAYKAKLLEAQKGCMEVGPETSPSYWSCIHGMGHGIDTYRDHDIPLALKDCDSLVGKIQTYCHDGVFMEQSISAPANLYKESDPLYPCDIVGESYKTACARSQVQVMRLRFRLNTSEIADVCLKSGNDKIIYHCIDALGYSATQGADGNSRQIISNCGLIKDSKANAQCLAAAAGELVFQNAASWQTKAPEVCSALTGDYKRSCDDRIEQVKKSYGR